MNLWTFRADRHGAEPQKGPLEKTQRDQALHHHNNRRSLFLPPDRTDQDPDNNGHDDSHDDILDHY